MLNGEVTGASFLGAGVRYDVRVGTLLRRVMAPADSAFTPGTAVQLRFGSNAAIAVAGDTPGS